MDPLFRPALLGRDLPEASHLAVEEGGVGPKVRGGPTPIWGGLRGRPWIRSGREGLPYEGKGGGATGLREASSVFTKSPRAPHSWAPGLSTMRRSAFCPGVQVLGSPLI
jgi:hypothetical protein